MKKMMASIGMLALANLAVAAQANNVAENHAWQFETTADKVNKAAIADIIEKKKAGYYAAPVYNTYIDHQYNCSVASSATGNQGTNTNLANAPTTTGPTSDATGNTSSAGVDGWASNGSTSSDQSNTGAVGSAINGDVSSNVAGSPDQALNSQQTNSGSQSASIDGSTACTFSNVLN